MFLVVVFFFFGGGFVKIYFATKHLAAATGSTASIAVILHDEKVEWDSWVPATEMGHITCLEPSVAAQPFDVYNIHTGTHW